MGIEARLNNGATNVAPFAGFGCEVKLSLELFAG